VKLKTPAYESTAILISTEGAKSDPFGGAAAFLGKKSTSGSGDLDLFINLMTSRTLLRKLLLREIPNMSDSAKGRVEPIYKILNTKIDNPKSVHATVTALSQSIKIITTDDGPTGGTFKVMVTGRTPWLAKELNDNVLVLVQDEFRSVRGERSDVVLERLDFAVKQAYLEWETASGVLAQYHEQNHSITLPYQLLEIDRLTLEREAKEQKYLMVRKEKEQILVDRAKAVPPAIILDSADVPTQKSGAQGRKILMIGVLIAFGVASAGVLAIGAIRNTFEARQ
jgi:uncharacterized protein involved in exopolysaccharide biosynthesis